MATAKVERDINGGTTVTLKSGDWKSEFTKDRDGQTYMVQRNHDGALVKRYPVDRATYNEILVVAQQFAAAENLIDRTIKTTWKIGRSKR